MWNYLEPILGTHTQFGEFTYTIEYVVDSIYYDVVITPLEENPPTVQIATNTISGYYGPSFDDTLTVRNEDNTFEAFTNNIGVFNSVNLETLSEVISFKPDRIRYKVFTYNASAYSGASLVATTTYQIILDDRNWTPGKLSLQELVQNASGNSTW